MSKPTEYTKGFGPGGGLFLRQRRRQIVRPPSGTGVGPPADTPLKVWDGTEWVPASAPPAS
jgi:hypothetical protein